jgi:hypothetical protein
MMLSHCARRGDKRLGGQRTLRYSTIPPCDKKRISKQYIGKQKTPSNSIKNM